MIATVTLNPAVDKTLNISRLIPGTVNRASSVSNAAGGKGINVAKVLHTFGYDVKALGFLGGYSGRLIRDSIKDYGIKEDFVRVKGQTRTSINVISEDGYVTEFLEPGPQIKKHALKKFKETFEREAKDCDIIVISGSAPLGITSDFYAQMVQIAKAQGCKVLLDTSGDNLKKGITALPFMIKPNMKELETLMGKRIQGMQEVAEAAEALVVRGIPHVMVSMGAKGILYATQQKKEVSLFYVQPPGIKAVNTVGSGDAAVAAFAMAMEEKLDPVDTLKKCVAISAANTLTLENGVVDIKEAAKIQEALSLCVPIY